MKRQWVRITAGLDTYEKRKILLPPRMDPLLFCYPARNLEYARVHKYAKNLGATRGAHEASTI